MLLCETWESTIYCGLFYKCKNQLFKFYSCHNRIWQACKFCLESQCFCAYVCEIEGEERRCSLCLSMFSVHCSQSELLSHPSDLLLESSAACLLSQCKNLPVGYYLSCIFWPLSPVPKCSPQGLDSLLAPLLLRLLQCVINFCIQQSVEFSLYHWEVFRVSWNTHSHEKEMIHSSYSAAIFTILCSLSRAQAKTLFLKITQCLPGFPTDGLFWLPLFPVIRHRPLPALWILWFL